MLIDILTFVLSNVIILRESCGAAKLLSGANFSGEKSFLKYILEKQSYINENVMTSYMYTSK